MKKRNICWLILALVIISCGRKESDIPVFGYSLNNSVTNVLILNIHKNKEVFNFEYLSTKDSIRNLDIIYNLEKDLLISDLDTFFSTEKTYNSKRLEFKMYQDKGVKSHSRTLVFNPKYGLLANLAYGADYILLKDSISKTESKAIFKELFLDLSKINIE